MTDLILGFLAVLVFELFGLGILRLFGFYTVVHERKCHVYVLWGKVLAVLDEPGFYFLWLHLGWKALIIHFFGQTYAVDLRLGQRYLRSQPVNSEEGAPMGIGVWYEMFISDPVAYLFKNVDPAGSLAANVGSATVRCLSNMPLALLLEERHSMSKVVREEVSSHSQDWGYKLGSVYVRKVHFRDHGMIKQIEDKVVNRLRQVTAAIRQDGENQVNVITSSAQRAAAAEFAKAGAVRPKILGDALNRICADEAVASALFQTLEAQRILESGAELVLVPKSGYILPELIASQEL